MAMVTLLFEAQFSVKAYTSPGEIVCISGNVPALGNWDPHKAVKLKRETSRQMSSTSLSSLEDEETVQYGDVWSKRIKFDTFEDIHYRYFVCQMFQSENEDEEESVVVKRWETNIKPRTFSLSDKNISKEAKIESFGKYDGQSSVTRGWLTEQSQINIDIYGNAIKMWQPRYKSKRYSIRCSTIDHYKDDEVEDETEYQAQNVEVSDKNCVLVSVLENGLSKPMEQPQYGVVCKPDGFLTFMVQALEPEATGFHLDFFMHEEAGSENCKDITPQHIGHCHILPVNIKKSKDTRTAPITSLKHKPLGQIQFDYLLIKPLIGQQFNLEVSYQMHWKRSRKALDIGHRGMGESYRIKQLASVRENTVESLRSAASHGADFVELDVHLTKDQVPVIYHDFRIHIAYRKKRQGQMELFEVAVKDLKLSELHDMKLFHTALPENMDEIHTEDLDPEDLQPFPTLRRCFESVDEHTGFNIEIKYPQTIKAGYHEQENYFDLNLFIDIVLREVFAHHGGRRIIFSSFDCDTCIASLVLVDTIPKVTSKDADHIAQMSRLIIVFADHTCPKPRPDRYFMQLVIRLHGLKADLSLHSSHIRRLRLKQNKYPVLMLTQADTTVYPSYADIRTQSIKMAAEFAQAHSLLGVNAMSEVLLKDMSLVDHIKSMGQVLFVWGEANNDKDTINAFRQRGVDAIIYDRIDHYKPGDKQSIFKVEHEEKLQQIQKLASHQNINSTFSIFDSATLPGGSTDILENAINLGS